MFSFTPRPTGRLLPRLLALALIVFDGTGCARVIPPQGANDPQTEGGRLWLNSLFWGIVQDNANVACPFGGFAEVQTSVVIPVSILTLGIWTPTRVSYRCEVLQHNLKELENGE